MRDRREKGTYFIQRWKDFARKCAQSLRWELGLCCSPSDDASFEMVSESGRRLNILYCTVGSEQLLRLNHISLDVEAFTSESWHGLTSLEEVHLVTNGFMLLADG